MSHYRNDDVIDEMERLDIPLSRVKEIMQARREKSKDEEGTEEESLKGSLD
jgi:hypothetical protein